MTENTNTVEAAAADLRQLHAAATSWHWAKGKTTHHTAAKRAGFEDYHVAEFRHADDAAFCDAAHASVPRILDALDAAKKRIADLEEYAKAESESAQQWRDLAMQFDGHRIQTLGHLKTLLRLGDRHHEKAREFLAAGPLDGEKVLAERLAAMPLQAQAREKLLRAEADARYIFGDGGQTVLDVIEWYAAIVALALDAPRTATQPGPGLFVLRWADIDGIDARLRRVEEEMARVSEKL